MLVGSQTMSRFMAPGCSRANAQLHLSRNQADAVVPGRPEVRSSDLHVAFSLKSSIQFQWRRAH